MRSTGKRKNKTLFLWQLIQTVTAADMKLQAADLLAWASNRQLASASDAFGNNLESIMKQIIPSSWIVFNEPRFRAELAKSNPCWHLVRC